ncbi:chromosome segregation protein SMC [Lewinella cohaerens]|uniref:chromosome segregation protein SMC n=1 Tax=Lewinella cohaerens TaxID=70995 RepID=UPI0003A303D9|nr:chromosome segregation protein SMC [Lewinella cohaerens]
MRLKQLEIKGFKSFANETQVNFSEDVIGIVGPNGSGKSNIVDAIRWVLGEQKSKELRLDQMSSVIFNGTKKKKASGMASVSLTFENTKNLLPTEYNTVTITRMLYRTGESEYRLNGVTCRLKDITSLFLDTGIGSNSYAIIALGMVDDILADKDNSRRKMFEQAAGISKYKIRKKQTLNKLKSTTEDLDRIEDLLYEINGNLSSLEKQAKRAKKYFELKNNYKDLSLQLARIKIDDLRDRHKTLQKQLTEEEDKYRQYEIDVAQLEAGIESERKAHVDKEKALSDRQRDLNNLISQLRNKESDRQMLKQRLQFITQNQEKLTQDIAQAKQRLTQLEGQLDDYRGELNAEKRVEARLELELSTAEDKLAQIRSSHGSVKANLDTIVGEQQAVEREVFEQEKRRAINQSRMENFEQQKARNTSDMTTREEDMKELNDRLAALEAKESDAQKQVDALELAEEQRQQKVTESETRLEDLNQRRTKVNRTLDAKRNEYKLTKSMIESLEGFPESIRFLSQNKNWKQDAPLLSDLLYVKEDYRVAIENYLEPYLNYYVVENLEEAYEAIQLLGRSQKGKANFFILDAFKEYLPPAELLPSGMLLAADLIEADDKYRRLVAYLLEKVLVVDSEDVKSANAGGEWIVLGRSGRFIRRRFSISGGSVGLFEGKKIGRKKNLEILEKAIAKAEREEQKLSTEYFQEKNDLERLKQQRSKQGIQQARQAVNQISQQKVSLVTRLENFQSFMSDMQQKNEQLQADTKRMEEENKEIDAQLAGGQRRVAEIKEQIANTDGSYREIAEELSAASAAFNEKNISFIRQQNRVTALQQELSFREKQLTEITTVRKRNEESLLSSDQEIQNAQTKVDDLEIELQGLYEEKTKREAGLTEAEQAYFEARGGINELEDKLRKVGRLRQDAQILINQLKDKFSSVKFDISTVAQRLRIEFSIDVNEFINQETEIDAKIEKMDPTELELKVERMKSRIDNYGEINPMAVEAYDEMKERFDTITNQREDIIAAKESLIKTIKEIEETATIQFLDAFDKARIYFIDVFRSLFTEDDNCDLILLEPENPLESKIEIVAKPKGKRPQSISQLSGGEKTLTATALLFALYLLKPAPFCIFDEVDAPLDDANITKFNRIIKKFSKESQFIIVTHNKLTMEAVDTIYGVFTNEQQGSGVLPVEFSELDGSGFFKAAQSN